MASSKANNTYYVKLANYGSSTQAVTVKIPDVSLSASADFTLLTGDEFAANYPGMVSVTPQNSTITGSAMGGYALSMPAWSVAVLAVSK